MVEGWLPEVCYPFPFIPPLLFNCGALTTRMVRVVVDLQVHTLVPPTVNERVTIEYSIHKMLVRSRAVLPYICVGRFAARPRACWLYTGLVVIFVPALVFAHKDGMLLHVV